VNIILFEGGDLDLPLPLSDRRAAHIQHVLCLRPGDSFDAGIINGPMGKALLLARDDAGLVLRFTPTGEPPPLDAISLIVGLPRPQTARKVLQEAAALGVQAMHFVLCERGEPGYARSSLWSSGEWRRHLIAGAEQAFSTRIPEVSCGARLVDAVAELPSIDGCRLALDNYEAPLSLGRSPVALPAVLALGPERGWSPPERALLRKAGFGFVHLGPRVLRVETACVAAIAVLKARLGLI
jgi:16S rRNA (uracil1498-N3)-methyltransferase